MQAGAYDTVLILFYSSFYRSRVSSQPFSQWHISHPMLLRHLYCNTLGRTKARKLFAFLKEKRRKKNRPDENSRHTSYFSCGDDFLGGTKILQSIFWNLGIFLIFSIFATDIAKQLIYCNRILASERN